MVLKDGSRVDKDRAGCSAKHKKAGKRNSRRKKRSAAEDIYLYKRRVNNINLSCSVEDTSENFHSLSRMPTRAKLVKANAAYS